MAVAVAMAVVVAVAVAEFAREVEERCLLHWD